MRINYVEGIASCLDTHDDLLPGRFPRDARIAQVRNVLMRTLGVWLGNTGHFNIGHDISLQRFRSFESEAPPARSRNVSSRASPRIPGSKLRSVGLP